MYRVFGRSAHLDLRITPTGIARISRNRRRQRRAEEVDEGEWQKVHYLIPRCALRNPLAPPTMAAMCHTGGLISLPIAYRFGIRFHSRTA